MKSLTTTIAPNQLDPALAEAYRQCAERNVLAALNPKVFFGYFSVCVDGQGHGSDTTYSGLDWGQSAEALLWLGRTAEVLASWEYVKSFQRHDGLISFAILPSNAGQTVGSKDHRSETVTVSIPPTSSASRTIFSCASQAQ